jgi:hypothetical protein
MLEPWLQRGALGSVHEASVVHCGAQVEVIAPLARSVQVSQAVEAAQKCPQAGAYVLHVPAWQVAAADPFWAMREPSSALSRPSKQPQPG